MNLLMDLILLAGSLMSLGQLDHFIIGKLLWLCIVNKLPNLKVSSSMIKQVYLKWLLFCLCELAPPHQVLDIYVQLSNGLVFALFDVCEVFIPGLPVTGAVGKGLDYYFRVLLLVWFHLVLQGSPSLKCLFATIEQNVYDLGFIGVEVMMKYCTILSL